MKALKYIFISLIISGCGIFASCSDDDKVTEPLTIAKVSSVLDREVGINTAELAQYIIVQGTGLDATQSILVNDVEVNLKTAYITRNEITFPVPRVVPLEVNNLITLKSSGATITTPIIINVPDLKIDGIGNEFAQPGKVGKIVGDFFDLYNLTTEAGQLFFGDKEMEIIEATETEISFVLPADATPGTKIKVVTPGSGERIVPGKYRERGNMLCDYDPYTGWGAGHYVSNGPIPEPTSGNYCHLKLGKSDAGDWEWSDATTILMIGATYFPEVVANPENYFFKFEVNTLKPLVRRQIRCFFAQIEYNWEPFASGLAFSTNGEWKTITLDLKTVWKGEIPNDGMIQILGNSWAEDTDICFDNFRIVAKD